MDSEELIKKYSGLVDHLSASVLSENETLLFSEIEQLLNERNKPKQELFDNIFKAYMHTRFPLGTATKQHDEEIKEFKEKLTDVLDK